MAHDKCFAICENKCLVETYPKEKLYTKDNFIIIEGTESINPKQHLRVEKSYSELGLDPNDRLAVLSFAQYDPMSMNYNPERSIDKNKINSTTGLVEPYYPTVYLKGNKFTGYDGRIIMDLVNVYDNMDIVCYRLVLLKL